MCVYIWGGRDNGGQGALRVKDPKVERWLLRLRKNIHVFSARQKENWVRAECQPKNFFIYASQNVGAEEATSHRVTKDLGKL